MRETVARGVVDTLGEGFRLLNRRLWILAIPAVIDLFLWLGPRVTAAGYANEMSARHADLDGLATVLGQVNLMGLLAWRFASAVGPGRGGDAGAVDLGTLPALALAVALLLVAGLAAFSVFYAIVVQVTGGRTWDGGELVRRATGGFVRVLALWAPLLLVAGTAAGGVAMLALAGPAGEAAAGALVMVAAAAALVLWLLLYLVHPAIFAGGLGPRAAVAESARIVRTNLGATIRLLALVVLITFGTGIFWQGLGGSAIGTTLAILGNAYIVTGMAVAVPIFYLERRGLAASGPRETPQGGERGMS